MSTLGAVLSSMLGLLLEAAMQRWLRLCRRAETQYLLRWHDGEPDCVATTYKSPHTNSGLMRTRYLGINTSALKDVRGHGMMPDKLHLSSTE